MATKVIMPQFGESVVEGTVTKWLIVEGGSVKEFDALLEVNTDKVDTEVPSPAAGTLLKILVPEGTTVTAGTVLAYIGQPGEAVPVGDAPATPAAQQAARAPAEPAQPVPAPAAGRELGFISPVVARMAREHNVDLQQVQGSGEGGRITKKDVLTYLETAAPSGAAQPEPAAWETPGEGDLFRPVELQFPTAVKEQPTAAQPAGAPKPVASVSGSKPGAVGSSRLIPLSTLRKSIAEHMVASERTSPHVTTVMEADLRAVVMHRQTNKDAFARDGANLTFTPYFVAAAVAALRAVPLVNSSWSEQGILVHPSINIGMATSLGEEGLIVPVIKGADGLSLLGLARAVNDLSARARARRLQPDEVKGGTFTITNHGISGSLFATPIINQPQCAILGVGAIQKRVVVVDDAIAIRPMAYISLTFDHRILDGASADGFLAKVVATLEKWV